MVHTTAKGYRRGNFGGRLRMEHVVAWERAFGPIKPGYQVHHINGDKADNRLTNLRLVDTITHKRIHSGCELRDGFWWKPCRICGEYKPIDRDWYLSPEGWPLYGRCRACHIKRVTEAKRLRTMRKGGAKSA